MDFFKFFIFGIAGVSVIFWVAVIALWHTYMFPRFFKNEQNAFNVNAWNSGSTNNEPILGSIVVNSNLPNRNKYSMKSLVVADFNAFNNLKLDKLYTIVALSVAFATFTIISYGLHSAFPFS